MTSNLVAVTGATGAVGSRVAARLAQTGAPLRLIVRDVRRAPAGLGSDVRPVAGYHAAGQLRAALAGVDTLLLIPAHESPDRVAQHQAAVDAAVAAVLTSDAHPARTYDLTGPHAFTLDQAADALSRATGKSIRFQDETDAEAWQSRRASGAPDWEIRGWISSYWAIRNGDLDRVSPAVRELTGHDPVSLDEYLHATPPALDHVTATGSA